MEVQAHAVLPPLAVAPVEQAGHVVCRPPETSIGVAWNVLPAHGVHTMSDWSVPAVV